MLVTPAASACSAIASSRLVLPIPPGPVNHNTENGGEGASSAARTSSSSPLRPTKQRRLRVARSSPSVPAGGVPTARVCSEGDGDVRGHYLSGPAGFEPGLASPSGGEAARAAAVEPPDNSNPGAPRWSSISSPELDRSYRRNRSIVRFLMRRGARAARRSGQYPSGGRLSLPPANVKSAPQQGFSEWS
jgi:hypothetical protein